MSGPRTTSRATVGIRDRRELPFFQVRVRAVRAIRDHTAGPRRLRAIGFYALLCQLANEQRHTGEHRIVRVTYDVLAARGQMSKRTVKLLLDGLKAADVIRHDKLTDRSTGAVVSLVHLLILDDPWIGLTVAMADHLAASRDGGRLLRDLGLLVVLLEFCAEQRAEHGGLAAEVMRTDIAAKSGLTVDRVDDCNRVLERAGVLEIERRRAPNGGRHLPSVYTIREAPSPTEQGGETVPAGRRNGTGRAESGYSVGGETVLAGRRNGTGRAESGYSAGGESASPSTVPPGSITHAGPDGEEKPIENTSASGPPIAFVPPSDEGQRACSPEEELCEALLAAWAPALGDSPRRHYQAHRSRWLTAAAQLLECHSRERLVDALDYMVTDEILGSQALTMVGLAKVADQLIARAYARRQRGAGRVSRAQGGVEGLAWDDAKLALERAVQRHGRDGRAAALEELCARSDLLVQFVHRIRWSTLCEQPMRYAERRYAELWAGLISDANRSPQEDAA